MTPRQPSSSRQRQRGASRALVLIAVAALVVLLAAGAGAAFYALSGDTDEPDKHANQAPPEPTFVTVKPMTVNLDGDSRVLYIGLSLAVADSSAAKTLETHMPEVRNRMLLALSDQNAQALTSAEGKRMISTTLADKLRGPYRPDGDPVAVEDVLFTDFIVQ